MLREVNLFVTTRVFAWSLRRMIASGLGALKFCGFRTESTFTKEGQEMRIIIRDTTQPEIYSREEVYSMLRLVRQNESRMGWKCPEPVDY